MTKYIFAALGVCAIFTIVSCSSNSGSSSSTPSTTVGTCTMGATGQYINSANGAACNCVYNGTQYTDTISGSACVSGTGVGTAGCTFNGSYYINPTTGQICSSSTGTAGCTLGPNGTYINPATGQLCSTTSTGSCILTPQGYYINQLTGQICSQNTYGGSGCSIWTQMYGIVYVPAYLNGQLVCVATY